MMSDAAAGILSSLAQVEEERRKRDTDVGLGRHVAEVKRFQHARFAETYADFLASPGTDAAARFFLEDLYGPGDFTARDHQFARVVPRILRVLPEELVATVVDLGCLHALSEQLDTEMGQACSADRLNFEGYREVWRRVGRPADRERQIQLMLRVGRALDVHARKPMLRTTLRLMRGPAHAAGYGALQRFLETGLDAFKALPDAEGFLNTIAFRERMLADSLFA